MLDQVVKNHLIFCSASEADDLPDQPGIYAWFLPLEADDAGDLKRLVQSLIDCIGTGRCLTEVEGQSGQLEISMRRVLPVIAHEPLIDELSTKLSARQVQKAAKLLQVCSFLTAPIYIGLTVNMGLKARINSHLQDPGQLNDEDWDGSFRSRSAWKVQDSGFLDRCLIACLPMNAADFSPEMVRLFEHILIRTIRPALSRRG